MRRQARYLADATQLTDICPFHSRLSYGETQSGKTLPLPKYTSLVAHRGSSVDAEACRQLALKTMRGWLDLYSDVDCPALEEASHAVFALFSFPLCLLEVHGTDVDGSMCFGSFLLASP